MNVRIEFLNMTLSLPPVNSLPMFEAAARHLHLGAAGTELHVTKGAVSQQVRRLEESLGVALFHRAGRRLTLTAAGEEYLRAIGGALRLVELATATARAHAREPLTIACTPGFAVQWLVPRLAALEARAPDLDVRLLASNQVSDFVRDRVDLAVRHGRGRYPGLCVEWLFDDRLAVVAAPARARRGLRSPADVRRHPLLHDEHRGDWKLWLEEAGLPADLASRGPVFTGSNAVLEAARAGRGLALVPEALAEADLAAGALVRCLPGALPSPLGYFLVYPEWSLQRPEAVQFRDWIREASAAPEERAAKPGVGLHGRKKGRRAR